MKIKILKYFGCCLFLFLIITPMVSAQCRPDQIKLNIAIGDKKCVDDFGQYIQLWYGFIIGAVGIMATVMIMYAGFKWLTSRGNASVISDAKEKIFAAIIGLILVFLSWTILNLINPKLLTIKLPILQEAVVDEVVAENQPVVDPDLPWGCCVVSSGTGGALSCATTQKNGCNNNVWTANDCSEQRVCVGNFDCLPIGRQCGPESYCANNPNRCQFEGEVHIGDIGGSL